MSPGRDGGGARVTVVGAGVSGLACAGALRERGVDVVVLDRGRRPGGRLGLRSVPGADGGEHLVDTGAAYFTVDGDPRDLGDDGAAPPPGTFVEVVHRWAGRGLVRPWTDTFHLAGPDGLGGTKTGPMRWAAPAGLRSLADDLAEALTGRGVTITQGVAVTSLAVVAGRPVVSVAGGPGGPGAGAHPGVDGPVDHGGPDAVVLAMPDPQAARVVAAGLGRDGSGDAAGGLADLAAALRDPWDPVVTVYARWDRRWWDPDLDAAFVQDETLSLVADDGRRRGDGEAVLVAHTTADAAAEHLDEPSGAVDPVLRRLAVVLGVADVPAPTVASAMRWTFSAPRGSHDEPFWLREVGSGGEEGTALVGVCGDSWGGRSKVERAWTSGHDLGVALAERLTPA